ncbi:MAG: HAMP domain-containing sensor histidine kinase [Bacteroidota bacterium]
MSFSLHKTRRLRLIFLVYWFLLSYIIAALVWWFIALNQQNRFMAEHEISKLKMDDPLFESAYNEIKSFEDRKTAQYLGEGAIFLLLILAGAFFIYKAVRRQFRSAQQQQNFMMAITHELKTPIAITKLNLETLQKRKLEEGQQQKLIQNTIQEANRLNALCNNMLLASQMEAGDNPVAMEEIDLTGLVQDCVQDFVTRFPQRILETELEPEISVEGDVLLLQMAVNNLIDNSIKYTPRESPVKIILEEHDKKIHLTVSDQGKGIEDSEKKKVFDKFYRVGNKATREAKGTGLGLFLTKKIAAQHKGRLVLSDNHPTGSNFTIILNKSGR